MKLNITLLLSLLLGTTLSAQLVITPGAQFSVTGNMPLTFQNTSLVNNGNFAAGNSIIAFTGNAPSSISGNQPIQFFELEMNKSDNISVVLQRSIGVTQRILFTAGFLNLNGFNTDLGISGHLDGEQEKSRITGNNGGQVLFTTNLNAPNGSNPANLGIVITSGQNLGNVTIRRGHQSQANGSGTGATILRYYDIVPENNTNPNATLRLEYLDGELNGLDENSLEVLRSENTTTWTSLGFTSRSTIDNFVEKTGIGSFGRFTLSNTGNPLPVRFTLFNVACEPNKVLVTWKTAQEQNSHHFNIERSTDGIRWTVTGTLPAAGNSNTERSYSFTDNNPAQNGYYRIAEYDADGKVQYSSIFRSACTITDVFSVWPNPVRDVIFINIAARNESQATIKVFDNKGALVKMQRTVVLAGSNQLGVDMKSLTSGIYQLTVEWNNGQMTKAVQVLKQ